MSSFSGPFFLLGVQRSGTTLLRMLLDQHSKIAIPFESMVLIEFYHRFDKKYNNLENIKDRTRIVTDLISARGISDWNPTVELEDININKCNDYSQIIDEIFSAYKRKCGKVIWGDKTPSYTKDFHILHKLFPAAKFIHVIRDGRDVALSLVRQPWGPVTFDDALDFWAGTIRCSRKMGKLLPEENYLEVRFEDLVRDPKENISKILQFLSLNYEERILNHDLLSTQHKLPSSSLEYHSNLFRPIDSALAFRWKQRLSSVDQALSWHIAGDVFEELDYPCGEQRVSKLLFHLRRLQLVINRAIDWRVKKLKSFIG